jgi:hypothetical protein
MRELRDAGPSYPMSVVPISATITLVEYLGENDESATASVMASGTLAQQEAELGFSVTTHTDLPYDPTVTNADNIAFGRAICQGMAGGGRPRRN